MSNIASNNNCTLQPDRLKAIIEQGWNTPGDNSDELEKAVDSALTGLDSGRWRIAEKQDGQWVVNTWLKQAVLLSFRFHQNKKIEAPSPAYDKVPLKFADWSEADFANAAVRAVPGSYVRKGAYIAPNVVLMPSFVNIGSYVDQGTLIDTWATVGSCAQVGANCHISGGVGIGGVLEPLQANPTIIEDHCFIGARSEIVEGFIVGKGSVIGMGVFLGASTPIINRATGETTFGSIPPYSVVIAGTRPGKPLPDGSPGPSLPCAVIVKQVDEGTRAKTAINDLLRP